MKKLLLVALVPILVLGFVGCGKVFDNVDPLPDYLMGSWTYSSYTIVFAGNQATVYYVPTGQYTTEGSLSNPEQNSSVTISFRVGVSYNNGTTYSNPVGGEGMVLEFYDFTEKKNNLKGSIAGILTGDGNAGSVLAVSASVAENQFYLIPPVGSYTKN
jgi:hypothetical protein